MELMRSTLFYALLVLLPRAFGKSSVKISERKINTTLLIHQKPSAPKKILLNTNGPPLVNSFSQLQSVFTDASCSDCIYCIEQAVKAYINDTILINNHIDIEGLQNEVFIDRVKRDSEVTNVDTKTKKPKRKVNKSVTVTKYETEGRVFALKIKEANTQTLIDQDNSNASINCQVYKVQKSFPCDTPEGLLILTAAKRKTSKKNKKDKDKNKIDTPVSTEKAKLLPVFKKREVDNSQVPENFMPSIEEMY